MSKRHRSHSTYVLITTGDNHFLKLLTLIKLYRDKTLYGYKLFLNHVEFRRLEGAAINNTTGTILRSGKPGKEVVGGLEVTYHRDGRVMFKDISSGQNFIREKHINIRCLGKPKIFFQIGGLPLKKLPHLSSNFLTPNNPQINLKNYKIGDYVNCDFYIGNVHNAAEIIIPKHTQHVFQKPFGFPLEDTANGVMLYIFLWQPTGIQKYSYLNIPSRKLSRRIGQIIDTIRLGQGRLIIKDYYTDIKLWFRKKIKST